MIILSHVVTSLVCMEEFSVGTSCHIFYQRHQVDKFETTTSTFSVSLFSTVYFKNTPLDTFYTNTIKWTNLKQQLQPFLSDSSLCVFFYRTYWISGQGKIVLPVPEELHFQRTLGKAAYGELTVLIVFDEIF